MTDIEILEFNAGGQQIKQMSAISFLGWLSNKLNGVTITPIVQELRTALSSPPMMNRLADETKIHYVRLLLKTGVTL